MKIYEFLKVKMVKCINANSLSLTENKEYQLLGVTDRSCMINDDDGYETWASIERFEPTHNHDMFKVGDKVYTGLTGMVETVAIFNSQENTLVTQSNIVFDAKNCCHATQENYELLCKLYPHIEFELTPEPITGSDLCRAMLKKWWLYVPCYTSNDSEEACVSSGVIRFIKTVSVVDGTFINNHNHSYKYAVPFDVKTGIPLTEDVLNDIN